MAANRGWSQVDRSLYGWHMCQDMSSMKQMKVSCGAKSEGSLCITEVFIAVQSVRTTTSALGTRKWKQVVDYKRASCHNSLFSHSCATLISTALSSIKLSTPPI